MIGGAVFPSHVVGILTNDRKSLVAGKGDRGPLADAQGHFEWGDYLTARPVYPDRKLFAAGGYTLLGQQDGGNVDATPRFVIFGRAADTDQPAVAPVSETQPAQPASTGDGGPITDVNKLDTVSSAVAAQIKAACGVHVGARAMMPPPTLLPEMVTAPGVERWPVKTGQDPDRNQVGKNIINGKNLGAGIVPATVEEMISIPRPPGLEDIKADPPAFQRKRSGTAEVTIWKLDVTITVLKLEADGDYHLVLEGASGDTMVGEIPTGTTNFVGDSPWLQNIKAARQAVDDKLVHNLNPKDFVLPPGGTSLVPRDSLSGDLPVPEMDFKLPESFRTPQNGQEAQMPAFKTKVPPTQARVTGVGFFDRMHGQTGVAPNVIELHPILKIEWM